MSKPYQNVGEIYKALIDGKKIYHINGDLEIKLSSDGNLVDKYGRSFAGSFFVGNFVRPSDWQEYVEPVTLEMAIAHYKKTGFGFMRERKGVAPIYWFNSGGMRPSPHFTEEDIFATDYILLNE